MKKIYLVAAMAAVMQVNSLQLMADDYPDNPETVASIDTVKGSMTFGAASIIGGLLAGPVGFMIGSVGGTVLAGELEKADQLDATEESLEATRQTLTSLEVEQIALKEQLTIARQQQHDLYDQVADGLTFQVLFYTGEDTLTESATASLDQLVTFLNKYPQLTLRLHGYADPRGTDEYNNVLAMHRTISVQEALEARGIDNQRIQRYSYGADQSTANKGDLDAYAMERRVTIEVISRDEDLASVEAQLNDQKTTPGMSW